MAKYLAGDIVRDPNDDECVLVLGLFGESYLIIQCNKHGETWGSQYTMKTVAIERLYTELVHKDVGKTPNKYDRKILGKDGKTTVVDVYRVLDAFEVTNPQLQHLAKKALCAGLRGHKDFMQDLKDIESAIKEAIQMEEQR